MDSFLKTHLTIAGIPMEFRYPRDFSLPDELLVFQTPHISPKIIYRAEPVTSPLCLTDACAVQTDRQQIYPMADGWLRVYPAPRTADGCFAALRLRNNGENIFYYPQSAAGKYQIGHNLLPLLGLEYPLVYNDCFLLHSSVVIYGGKAVLFTGASGVGKSTQAEIWRSHLGAKIINGDRCAIVRRAEGFYGCGSPLAGSSDIYVQAQAPIAGIFFLSQGRENTITPLTAGEAFGRLYSQCLLNTWDQSFMNRLCALLEALIRQVPMYSLCCLPDDTAAQLACDALGLTK